MVREVQHPNQEEALVAHRTARLNLFGRRLLVTRIAVDGWAIAKAAEAQGVSRTTAHKWIARYRAEGWSGLEDRSSRPHHSPRLTSPEQVAANLHARVERRWGPHRLCPAARSAALDGVCRAGADRVLAPAWSEGSTSPRCPQPART